MESAKEWFWLDGNWKSENELKLSLNRSFLYGDGFFETIRISVGGKILLKKFHWERIKQSCLALSFPWPEDLSETRFWDLIFSKIMDGAEMDLRIKIIFYRYGEGRYAPENEKLAFYFSSEPLAQPWLRFGKSIARSESAHIYKTPVSWIKSTSAQTYVLAGIERTNKEVDDLVLCNPHGYVVEGCFSSLFWSEGDKLVMPSSDLGGIKSCMKLYLTEFWKKTGIQFEFKRLLYQELLKADWLGMANATGIVIFELNKKYDEAFIPDFSALAKMKN